MELTLKNINGENLGSIEVRDDVFNIDMNQALLHQVIVAQLANKRQGTAKVKTRSEVSGGGAKPRPQKHTGRSRQGSIRSPLWRKGGVTFGPSPRDYSQRTPKRVKRQALKIVLSDKARENRITILDKIGIDNPKTKSMLNLLKTLDIEPSTLMVLDGENTDIYRTINNIPKVKCLPSSALNPLDLLNARSIVATLDSIRNIESLWGGNFDRFKNRNSNEIEISEKNNGS
ncbi:MAG: 50S ribosomal protein L4 [Chloroflexi bacterium]|nr:50S ribosomal protein L4 [Chloroflexota bacterium]|tara:strand:+ start:68564 stop:69253 length:690 start_codon:yes stop_codon:yes gene_type:complete